MKLDRSYRAYHTWKTLHCAGEGSAIPEEALYLIIDYFERRGQKEYASITETSLDAYFRTHEWCKIRGEDIFYDGELVGIALGVQERGERVKTGVNQGVVLDSPYLRSIWASMKQSKLPHELVFASSATGFKQAWEEAKRALHLEWIGPEHRMRHAGAARDIERGTRSLEQIRRRGRWRCLDSVQRYTKTWLLIRARGLMTAAQREAGSAIAARRPPRDIRE